MLLGAQDPPGALDHLPIGGLALSGILWLDFAASIAGMTQTGLFRLWFMPCQEEAKADRPAGEFFLCGGPEGFLGLALMVCGLCIAPLCHPRRRGADRRRDGVSPANSAPPCAWFISISPSFKAGKVNGLMSRTLPRGTVGRLRVSAWPASAYSTRSAPPAGTEARVSVICAGPVPATAETAISFSRA